MRTIGFIGAYDKTDFIMHVAKALVVLGKKVLVVDNTLTLKAKYIVPAINPTKAYVTEYEKIDVAIGLESFEQIKRYFGTPDGKELEYDYSLVDVDSIDNFYKFNIMNCSKNYFVTSFDLYSLKKGLEILTNIEQPIKLTKILFSKEMSKEDNEYLDFLSLETKVMWNDEFRVYLPMDNGDQTIIIENQRISRIGIKRLSMQYKESLSYIVEDIADGDVNSKEITKAFRILEREG